MLVLSLLLGCPTTVIDDTASQDSVPTPDDTGPPDTATGQDWPELRINEFQAANARTPLFRQSSSPSFRGRHCGLDRLGLFFPPVAAAG